ncbi:MAG: glycosyltransferase family 87 protein [Actinomycetes bacterium]
MDVPPVVAPSREDPVVVGMSETVGGPVGRRALLGRHGWTTALILVVLTLVTCIAGFGQKLPCRDPGNWTHEFQYTHLCYSDLTALYYSEGLVGDRDVVTDTGTRLSVPYADHAVEYPVVIGGLMWVGAEVANHLHPNDPHLSRTASGKEKVSDARPLAFFDVTALILTAFAVITVLAVCLTHRRRPWDAALVALSPALVFHAFTNWDLAAAAFASLALLAWARRRPWLAGLFLGLGTATKLYPVLFLVPLFVLCLRGRRLAAWWSVTIGTAITWFVVNAPVMVSHFTAWKTFYVQNKTRPADFDSLWFVFNNWHHTQVVSDVHQLNIGVAVAVGVALAAVGVLILVSPRRPRLPQVLFLSLAAFLLLNKVDSPQYVIWLVPLAALARPKWSAFLLWQLTEIPLLVTRYLYFVRRDDPHHGLNFDWFASMVLMRDAALLFLMALVVREILRPEHDVVRRFGDDDPAGGVLDNAPDGVVVHSRLWPAAVPA